MASSPFIPAWPDLRPFIADIWLMVTAVAVLLSAFFVRKPNTAAGTVAFVGVLLALGSLLAVRPTDAAANRFAPMLAADGVAFLWQIILLLFAAGVVLLWFASSRHRMREGDGPEFFLLLLTATLGMALMGSASNLLMIFVAVEMASLPSYMLAGFRKNHRPGAEASLKYVLFGVAATSVMVWGLSLVYGMCGTLNLYGATAADGSHIAGVAERAVTLAGSPMLLIGMLAMLVGIGFKIAAVPFHLWCPDVFEGADVDLTAFLSVASKGAGLVLLLRVTHAVAEAAHFAPTTLTTMLAGVIAVLGALSCTVGNTAAYAQTNLKRLLAYSSIAQAGYMLCAVALIVRGSNTSLDFAAAAPQALLFYLAIYLFMNLGAFAVVAVVARQTGGETLDHFRGLGRRSPFPAFSMALCCFSLIGVPPLAGFAAKFNIMQLLAAAGGWWWALVIAIAVNTLLSIYYYARIIGAMYLHESDAPVFRRSGLGGAIASISAFVLILLFVEASRLSELTTTYGRLRPAVASGPAPQTIPLAKSDGKGMGATATDKD